VVGLTSIEGSLFSSYCSLSTQQYTSHNRSVYRPTALLAAIGGAPSWRRAACGGLVGRWEADVRCCRHRRMTSSNTPTSTGMATHGTITCINSVLLIAAVAASSPPVITVTLYTHPKLTDRLLQELPVHTYTYLNIHTHV